MKTNLPPHLHHITKADYIIGVLVNSSFEIIKQIKMAVQTSSKSREELCIEMEYVWTHLKYGFNMCMKQGNAEDCILHNIERGLQKEGNIKKLSVQGSVKVAKGYSFLSETKDNSRPW